ncbi:putative protein-S-isoprenylcysteine O-methyltransferase [Tritrichomonas foetus]|uniref:Protein-S-isoprenylcysteine O-methyltransferase n=1 Tax=Tritrichomonas foetus TaxID=1144522 RepID=A0A1J4K1L4_9EUKA|nr:putative protein-S-isoprenylcysteine O-methyltransferase [Tritrichomonas foetus]|eukprot:OHT05279.1 putative protein-S-isoprenylcysteine O-methyltransferase [Tritrichomonas foetus]
MIEVILQLSVLVIIVIIFHIMEYFISRMHHPDTTSSGSLLVTIPFLFAFSFGVAEFIIEFYLFGENKINLHNITLWTGLVLSIVGLAIRILAELTAKQSFTHHIAYKHEPQHKLITHGIYGVIRHPGYFGMFVFSVGTQIYLRNPVSTVVFASVLWKFFSDRIQDEETALVSMFGAAYVEYRAKTRTWFPMID